jgi:N-methylhydantoinase A/oxoprolinase/acetone carboxylase beta subunit
MVAREFDMGVDELCAQVVDGVSDRVSQALVTKVLSDEGVSPDWEAEPSAVALLRRALGDSQGSDLACDIKLQRPVVAIGAPVEAYMPRVADQLGTELVIPSHAEVANAVGAVTGSVVQQIRVTIQPLEDKTFRVHLPDGVRDFSKLEDGVRHAEDSVKALVKGMAREAGAEQVDVRVEREDKTAPVRGDRIYLGTELRFTATGRPSLAA